MSKVSVVAKHAEGDIAGGTPVDDVNDAAAAKSAGGGAVAGTQAGGVVGGLIGLLAGASALAIPGVGPVIAGGALATVLSSTVVGSAAGASIGALGGALVGYGIPDEDAGRYEQAVNSGGYLVIIDGSETELRQAETILHNRGIQNYGLYDVPSRILEDQKTDTPRY